MVTKQPIRVGRIALTEEGVVLTTWAGNGLLVVLKLVVGLWANSVALVAEAVHSAADVVASAGIYLSLRLSRSERDSRHPYGRGKLQSLATVGIAVLLLMIAWELGHSVWTAWRGETMTVPGVAALWVTGLCLVAKELMYRITIMVGRVRGNTMLVADAWHHRTDAFILAGVFIGVLGARLGWVFLDPLVGLLISLSVARIGVVLGWQGMKQLLDVAPDEDVIQQLRAVVAKSPGVERVDRLRVRQYGPELCVEVSVAVAEGLSVAQGHDIGVRVKERLQGVKGVIDVVVHVNPCFDHERERVEPSMATSVAGVTMDDTSIHRNRG